MGFYNNFPYTNFHELNLDWIIQELKKLTVSVQDFISINAIKYANPIQWDITSQYEKNTVVLDEDGNAYLSVQPVPAGVSLDRTEYWTNIGNFSALWENVKSAIAVPDEGHNTTASTERQPNTLVWVDGKLLEVTKAMNAGDAYNTSEGGNSRLYTMQMLLDALLAEITDRKAEDFDIRKNVSYVNVVTLGLVGDGRTDNTDALKNALLTHKNLFFPSGIYYMDSLSISNAKFLLDADAAIFPLNPLEFTNSSIMGGTIKNTSVSSPVYFMDGINFINSTTIDTRGNNVTGIRVYGGQAEISNCKFLGTNNAYFGVWSDNAPYNQNINIINCYFNLTKLNGVFSCAKNTNIIGCVFDTCHTQTTPTGGGCVDIVARDTTNISAYISGCHMFNGGGATSGVEMESNGRTYIVSNIIDMKDQYSGVAVQNSKAVIRGNIITGNTCDITVTGPSIVTSSDNVLLSANKHYMLGSYTEYSVITANENEYEGDLLALAKDVILTYPPIAKLSGKTIFSWSAQLAQGGSIKGVVKRACIIAVAVDNNVYLFNAAPGVLTPIGTFPENIYYVISSDGAITFTNGDTTAHTIRIGIV